MTDEELPADEDEGEDEATVTAAEWPIKGPATPAQALLAIAFVFFVGVAIGFLLCQTF